MTKKKSKRNRKNFVSIPFETSLSLATLADNTILLQALTAALGEDLYIISVDILLSIHDHTPGEVPIYVGLAHSDLSITEVAQYLDSDNINPDDIIAKERSRRPVRRIGVFNRNDSEMELNNGVKIRQIIKFSVGNGFTLNLYVKNDSGAALTTGSFIDISGVIYGRWQR